MINLKQGLRRISIVILILINLCYITKFIFSGCIFYDIDYISQAKVINSTNNSTISLIDFSQKYFEKDKELYQYTQYYFEHLGFRVHPYKRYFKNFDNVTFKNNEHIKINNEEYIIKLPSVFNYFVTQLWQFLLIPLCNLIIIGLYLLIEFILSWILKGFKD